MRTASVKAINRRLLTHLERQVQLHLALVGRYSFAEAIMYDQYNEGLIYNDFLHFCYTKSVRTLDATLCLLQEGFREDPMILLRAAYENYLSFWYVVKNEDSLDSFVEAKVGRKTGSYTHPKSGPARHLRVVNTKTGEFLDHGKPISELARRGSPRISEDFHRPFYEYLCEFSHNHFIALGGYLSPILQGKFSAARPGIHLETSLLALIVSTLWVECMPIFEDLVPSDRKAIRKSATQSLKSARSAVDALECDKETEPFRKELVTLTESLMVPLAS